MSNTSAPIPYAEIDTLFLDLGNTLVSPDFAWIASELGGLGVDCTSDEVHRAEAAARPGLWAALQSLASLESDAALGIYVAGVLRRLPATEQLADGARRSVGRSLVTILETAGKVRMWSVVLPGVPQALGALREAGLRLVVVSNSDGTAEAVVRASGLQDLLDEVFDSAVVGFEKPDPRLFLHAADAVGVDPARTLHTGDIYEVDVVGAHRAGMHAALVDPFDDWTAVDCSRVRDLTELASQLTKA